MFDMKITLLVYFLNLSVISSKLYNFNDLLCEIKKNNYVQFSNIVVFLLLTLLAHKFAFYTKLLNIEISISARTVIMITTITSLIIVNPFLYKVFIFNFTF